MDRCWSSSKTVAPLTAKSARRQNSTGTTRERGSEMSDQMSIIDERYSGKNKMGDARDKAAWLRDAAVSCFPVIAKGGALKALTLEDTVLISVSTAEKIWDYAESLCSEGGSGDGAD